MEQVDLNHYIERMTEMDAHELSDFNEQIKREISQYNTYLKNEIERLNQINGNVQFNKLIETSISNFERSIDGIRSVQDEIEANKRIFTNVNVLTQKYRVINKEISNITNTQSSISDILPLYEEEANTIFIIGKNGSGKSRYLKTINDQISSQQFVYIPAYREYNKKLSSGRPPKAISLREGFKLYDKKNNHYNTIEEILDSINQVYFDSIMRKQMEDKYEIIKQVWNKIFSSDSILHINPQKTKVNISKHGTNIDSSNFSDGEYNIFVILTICMFMPESSYIAIDEIELHLNLFQLKALINNLNSIRPDIQFLITTHNYYLIREFQEKSIFYMKNGNLEKIENIEVFENDKEKIYDFIFDEKLIFCEGTNETDVLLYKKIFPDYQVIPSGSCEQVKELVRTLQNEDYSKKIYGIIDRDHLSENEISEYASKNIIVLPYRHKENFLISEFNLNLFLDYLEDDFQKGLIQSKFEKLKKDVEQGNRKTNFKNDYKYNVTKDLRNAISKGKDLFDIKEKIMHYIENEYPTEEMQPVTFEDYLIKNPLKNNIREVEENYQDWFISKLDNSEMAGRLRENYFSAIENVVDATGKEKLW